VGEEGEDTEIHVKLGVNIERQQRERGGSLYDGCMVGCACKSINIR
jgi:hypothetical protein